MGGAVACYVPTLLLTYATTHGHTATIADRLADALRALGIGVDLRDVQQLGDADPGSYDAVVAGASVHAGHHQRAMLNWVKANRDNLAAVPTLFLSVSLTAAELRSATHRLTSPVDRPAAAPAGERSWVIPSRTRPSRSPGSGREGTSLAFPLFRGRLAGRSPSRGSPAAREWSSVAQAPPGRES
jgi:hypothetical protein